MTTFLSAFCSVENHSGVTFWVGLISSCQTAVVVVVGLHPKSPLFSIDLHIFAFCIKELEKNLGRKGKSISRKNSQKTEFHIQRSSSGLNMIR